MFKEQIIQISGHRALTNKGRIFDQLIDGQGNVFWTEITLPVFDSEEKDKIIKGKTKFISPISDQERFENADDIGDLIDE